MVSVGKELLAIQSCVSSVSGEFMKDVVASQGNQKAKSMLISTAGDVWRKILWKQYPREVEIEPNVILICNYLLIIVIQYKD